MSQYTNVFTYTLDGETHDVQYRKYIPYEEAAAITVQVASLVVPDDSEYKPYMLDPALVLYCLEYFTDMSVDSLSEAYRILHETTLWDDLYVDCSMIQDIERDVLRMVRQALRKSKGDELLDSITSLVKRVDAYAADLPDMRSLVDLLGRIQSIASDPTKIAEVVQLLQEQKSDE